MTAMPTAPPISRRLTAAAFARDDGEGRWITVRGTHVLIKDGKIASGPSHLVGKSVGHLEAGSLKKAAGGDGGKAKIGHVTDSGQKYDVLTKHEGGQMHVGYKLKSGSESYPIQLPENASLADAHRKLIDAMPGGKVAVYDKGRAPDAKAAKGGDTAKPEPAPAKEPPTPAAPAATPRQALEHAVADLNATAKNQNARMWLSDVREKMAAHGVTDKAEQDKAITEATLAGDAVPVRMDNPAESTPARKAAEYRTPGGQDRHLLYWTGNPPSHRVTMSRTDAELLDVLTFDRGRFDAAAIANSDLGPGEVVAPKEGEATDSLGHPILYVEKPMLEVGGVADTDEGRMVITAEALELADRCTREWINDGGKPFIPRGHRNFDENYNLGWLKDTKFDGKRLLGRHQLIGADAHLAAARNDSSVLLRWNFRHGGKVYPLIVEHNAILPDPKMRGLGEFVALGREGQSDPERVPVWTFVTMMGRGDAGGHWITLEGRHILIPDTAGIVPARVKAEPGALKRFTRANLEKAITDHHREKSGESGEYTTGMERELTEAAGDAEDAFRFHKKLPTEIKDAIGENPALRRVFTTTDDAKKAHGSDAYSALGDRYIDIAEARAGSPLRQAKAFARSSGDPEAAFVAHIHDNLPESAASLKGKASKLRASVPKNLDRAEKLEEQAKTAKPADAAKLRQEAKGLRRDAADAPARAAEHDKAAETAGFEPVKAGGLRVGDEFTIGGKAHRVAEDEHGFRVLRSHEYGKGDVPLDAVSHVPVDRGSFRRSKVSRRLVAAASDGIPFSRRLMAFGRKDFTEGHFREIDGHTVFLAGPDLATGHLWGGTRGGKTAKILTRGGTKTVTVAPHSEGHRVTESGPGAGQHTHADHPTAAAAVADARSRIAGAEANAKAKGEHVATMEKVPGERPGGRYSVRHVVGENGQAAAYLIDHKSGDVMRPTGSIVRHYDSAADAHAIADRMNAREAGAGVPGVSKRLTQAAEAPMTGNPTVDTARQFGLFAKDAAGSPLEIGEKPGQANLFNASKYDKGPPPKAAPAPKDEPGQMVMGAAVSARLQAAAATPGEPAKSAGHVGFYRDNINRPRELYKDPAGNLHSASTDNPVDPSTGRRPGRHEAGPAGADRAAAHLMSGAKVIQRQGGASAFSPRARADVRENARAVLAGNAAPAAPAVSKRLEAAAGKGENGGMETPKEGPRRSETTFETGDAKVPQIKLSVAKATAGEAGEVRAARVDAKGVHNYNYYKKLPTMAEARAHYEELKVKYERDAKAAGKFKGMSEAHG